MTALYRIGVDENGLGARLGPLVVTAVLARVDERGHKQLTRRLPKRIAADLGDSKDLVSHHDYALGEAWARALLPDTDTNTPESLFERLSHQTLSELQGPCPGAAAPQCWRPLPQTFAASDDTVSRLRRHREALNERGVEILSVRSRVVCTKLLNDARVRGHNRFIADLHAMEQLILSFREQAGANVEAVCGKVGGIGEYSKFFGPLGGRLHMALEEGRARSSYRFPGIGELHFVRDADAAHALVMLASLVGKYVRELLMQRIAGYYVEPDAGDDESRPSGYHDPVTARFVAKTQLVRRTRRIPDTCFERDRDAHA